MKEFFEKLWQKVQGYMPLLLAILASGGMILGMYLFRQNCIPENTLSASADTQIDTLTYDTKPLALANTNPYLNVMPYPFAFGLSARSETGITLTAQGPWIGGNYHRENSIYATGNVTSQGSYNLVSFEQNFCLPSGTYTLSYTVEKTNYTTSVAPSIVVMWESMANLVVLNEDGQTLQGSAQFTVNGSQALLVRLVYPSIGEPYNIEQYIRIGITKGTTYVEPTPSIYYMLSDYDLTGSYEDGYDQGYIDGRNDGKEWCEENNHAAIRQEGSEEGYTLGYDVGYSAGKFHGEQTGYELGYDGGYQVGKIDGYDEGYVAGKTACEEENHEKIAEDSYFEGMDYGYANGKTAGYKEGYAAITEETKEELKAAVPDELKAEYRAEAEQNVLKDKETFLDLIYQVVDAPFKVIRTALNFEILGINISSLVLFLLTGLLLVFVVRKLGGR